MSNTVLMYGPPSGAAQVSCGNPQGSGQNYQPDALGFIIADPRDVPELLRAGWTISPMPTVNFRNIIDGGDFSVNPFQRNIPGLATAGVLSTPIAATPGYFADRFFAVGNASSAILMAAVADASVPGFNQALTVTRQAANANTGVISFGQVLETADCIRCQGQFFVLSLWAKALANFSALGNNVTVSLVSGTGTNQSAASMVAGTWTGYTVVAQQVMSLSSVMTRLYLAGFVPSNSSQLGILIQFTPVGTAGAADGFQINGVQVEKGLVPSSFDHRDVQVELEICQRYCWVIPEPGNGVVVGAGITSATATQQIYMATPVQLRSAPTVTVAVGTFKMNLGPGAVATTITAGGTHTPNAITINGNTASATAGGALLTGGGGTGNIIASSDF